MTKQWKKSLEQTDIVSDGTAFQGSYIDQPISEAGQGVGLDKTLDKVTAGVKDTDTVFTDTTDTQSFSGTISTFRGLVGSEFILTVTYRDDDSNNSTSFDISADIFLGSTKIDSISGQGDFDTTQKFEVDWSGLPGVTPINNDITVEGTFNPQDYHGDGETSIEFGLGQQLWVMY